jgi:inhibitor of the pro-sigma K processing machinery
MYQIAILAAIFVIGLVIAYAGNRLHKPIEYAIKFLVQVAVGVVAIIIFNVIFTPFDFKLAINPITAVITGQLGIPGFAALIIIKLLIA